MPRMKITRRQFPFTPRFLPSTFLAPLGEFGDFGDLANTQQLFDDVFGKDFPVKGQGWAPAVNVAETKDEFTVSAELPGMKADDVSVDFTDGMLTIRGEKLPFPGGIDDQKLIAEFKDGVLKVRLPKVEEVKPKRLAIPIVTK